MRLHGRESFVGWRTFMLLTIIKKKQTMSNNQCAVTNAYCQSLADQFGAQTGNAVAILTKPEDAGPFQGVCTFLHKVPGMLDMTVNGVVTKTPLNNVALFSTECVSMTGADGSVQSLPYSVYEIMVPDKPAVATAHGSIVSQAQQYVHALGDNRVPPMAVHYHNLGVGADGALMAAVHNQSLGMSPNDFVNGIIAAQGTAYDIRYDQQQSAPRRQ